MLERTIHPGGVVTWQSPLLQRVGVRHGFSTRIGGISTGPFASLNLGNPGGESVQDALENIHENFRRLQDVLACPPATLRAWVRQIHSNRVELVSAEPENEYAETLEAEIRDRFSGQLSADALATGMPNVLLTIRTADCIPILLASSDGRLVAAVHAGWRGIVSGVIASTLCALQDAGAAPGQLIAAIGPAISAEHFEVGEEVAAEFHQRRLSAAVIDARPGRAKPHIDLPLAADTQLRLAGIPPLQIDTNTLCTFRDAADFFSHRREQGLTGRMAAVIMPKNA